MQGQVKVRSKKCQIWEFLDFMGNKDIKRGFWEFLASVQTNKWHHWISGGHSASESCVCFAKLKISTIWAFRPSLFYLQFTFEPLIGWVSEIRVRTKHTLALYPACTLTSTTRVPTSLHISLLWQNGYVLKHRPGTVRPAHWPSLGTSTASATAWPLPQYH